jgi:hypothetical protein
VTGLSQALNAPVTPAWVQGDINELLDKGLKVVEPEILTRTDGRALFYLGKLNGIVGESESAKTWLALLAATQLLKAHRSVMMIDYESDLASILGRLLSMGVPEAILRAGYFQYYRIESKLTHQTRAGLEIPAAGCALVVIDGVTEAMAIQGLKSDSDTDIASFYEILPKWLADAGPAVVTIDHPSKARDSRGSYANGSQHKKSGITGAYYGVDVKEPWGKGRRGRTSITVFKDRNGAVRAYSEANLIGTLHGDSTADANGDFVIECWIEPPTLLPNGHATGSTSPMKTYALKQIISLVKQSHQGISKTAAHKSIGGNKQTFNLTAEWLVNEGYLRQEKQHLIWVRDYDEIAELEAQQDDLNVRYVSGPDVVPI